MVGAVEDITIQPTENPDCRVYNTRYELCSAPERGCRGEPSELGEFGCLVLDFRGVVSVTLLPYMMIVIKAPLFHWEEVEPKILELLSDFVRSQRLIDVA